MQVQKSNVHRSFIRDERRGYGGLEYIMTDVSGFDARSVRRRSFQQPGFLRNCEQILFEPDGRGTPLELEGLATARES